ncbi:CCA1 [Candida oxycetoniae]|uniref:CCA tRNA nucleotidyltransferase, mitochondrial n=1 Tax=Candida oxycetoniae TaxID=497107 RepID=A0AAI9SXE0_9ASCO|nr:CCA1 [Candida oxycetoniae]KAI3404615.2 CCA1 [Candida oxycetoniae]
MNRKATITLNESESKIRDLLVGYCDHIHAQGGTRLTLRITGGWVRDKLLGFESHDIDIAIDHQTGEEFVKGLSHYLKTHDNPELSMKHIHTIKSNPLKSKHLETCTTKMYGIDLDFVNLRSEEYTEDSRVPVIEFGTPEQDAMRRDATLNALFYNMNEKKIEDFTGTGLEDLKNGILRTPLPPIKTFLDDPLRILRLIRFASKFNFLIDPTTLDAMMESHNQKALSTKISKERIEIELRKMLVSDNPSYGLKLIHHCNLVHSLFYLDELEKEFDREALESSVKRIPHHLQAASAIFPYYKKAINSFSSFIKFPLDDDSKFRFWLAMILHPYSVIPRVNNNKDIYDQFLRFGLKCKKSDIAKISKINMTDKKPIDMFFKDPSSVKRSDLGKYLRNFPEFADLNLLVQCFIDCIHGVHIDKPLYPTPSPDSLSEEHLTLINQTVAKYESLFSKIKEWNLSNVHLLKPLEGTKIANALNRKPGPWMAPVIDKALIWQLDNPTRSRDECLQYIMSLSSSS